LFSYNEKSALYCLDEYDAASGSFVKTLTKFSATPYDWDEASESYAKTVIKSKPTHNARVLVPFVINDYLYLLMSDSGMQKINLSMGTVEKEIRSLPESAGAWISEPPVYCASRKLLTRSADKLYYGFNARPGNLGFQHYVYDLVTDEIARYDVGDVVDDYSVRNTSTHAGMVYCFGFGTDGRNNGRELAIYGVEKKDFIAQLTLPDLDGKNECDDDDDDDDDSVPVMNDRRESHLIVGNSIFVAQLGGEKYGDQNIVLHQIV
jgi:hypothetical protein